MEIIQTIRPNYTHQHYLCSESIPSICSHLLWTGKRSEKITWTLNYYSFLPKSLKLTIVYCCCIPYFLVYDALSPPKKVGAPFSNSVCAIFRPFQAVGIDVTYLRHVEQACFVSIMSLFFPTKAQSQRFLCGPESCFWLSEMQNTFCRSLLSSFLFVFLLTTYFLDHLLMLSGIWLYSIVHLYALLSAKVGPLAVLVNFIFFKNCYQLVPAGRMYRHVFISEHNIPDAQPPVFFGFHF